MFALSCPLFRVRLSVLNKVLAVLLLGTLACGSACLADDPSAPVTGHLSLYVNGALQGSADCPSTWNATGHTQLGRGLFDGKQSDFVTGLLGDVRVYDRVLSEAQVKTLYQQGPQTEWHIDHTQGSAQAQTDQSGPLNLAGTNTSVDTGRSLLNTARSYTVSAWVSLSSLDACQTFVSQDGKTISSFCLQKRGEDNKFALAIRSADAQNSSLVTAESPILPKINTLYHVVGVFQVGPTAAAPQPTPPAAPAVLAPMPWDAAVQGKFLESLAQDRRGRVWVATEDQGVWCHNPAAPEGKQWTQFTTKDGLGSDDVYALLVDHQNRVWAGTLHGVSVYDGKAWKTYGPLDGLGGFRIFALAACPTSGDVWIATEGGLTRYIVKTGRWRQYSRLDGLPSDAVQCLAFDKGGTLYVGTQCDGIATASPLTNYKTWRTVRGPASLPETAGGAGLPTSLINCLYIAHDGTVYAGTTTGLARSSNGGKTWRFLRGADWMDKRDGQHPQGWLDGELTDQAEVRAIEVLPQAGPAIRIAAGGGGEGEWKADHDFIGGRTYHTNYVIDSSAVENPAPQSVYQSARFGSFSYVLSGLKPGVHCRVRLHLAEVIHDNVGQRTFNVAVNGKRVLTYEDIFAEAGARSKLIVKEFPATVGADGHLLLSFRGPEPLPSLDPHSPYELSEDYVTALAEDGAGHLLVGHRQKGVEMLNPATGKHVTAKGSASPETDFVTALLPRAGGSLLIAGYGAGLSEMPIIGTTSDGVFAQVASASPAALPAPEPPPTLAELNDMLQTVSVVAPNKNELAPHVVALPDDWLTQGDWLGRYGRYWACLNAICSPQNYLWGAGWDTVNYASQIGPHAVAGDNLRYFVATLYTQNSRTLEMPPTYLDSRIKKGLTTGNMNRREAEIDDHGEVYIQALGGPDIYTTLTVPDGLFTLSLYVYNKDAHGEAENRLRDYGISIRTQSGKSFDNINGFATEPELAHGRVRGFWGGVYKRFLVRGPVTLTVKLDRNYSRNTILQSVMLDLVDETPPPYFGSVVQWKEVQTHQQEQRHQALLQGRIALFQPGATEQEAASRLVDALKKAQADNSTWWGSYSRQFYAPLLRWYMQAAEHVSPEYQASFKTHIATCLYQMGQYQAWEEQQKRNGLTPARDVEKALRWNGISDAGEGYQVVTDYLAFQYGKMNERPSWK